MNKPIIQKETRVLRTYKGGKLLEEFLGYDNPADSFYPEDWISSFVEAKNKTYTENEGLTRVITNKGEQLLRDIIEPDDFGVGRKNSGILIKYLDSAERLGIQVHPTKEYALKHFGTPFGKTECWHILGTRNCGEAPCIYLGFKPHVSKELWAELFKKQDINGMLECMHKFYVNTGDTILVKGGFPHAIGGGCFLLEIQEPTDYTMRVERVTVAGDTLTDMQMHYGVGFDNMLDCFTYTPYTREEIEKQFILKAETVTENENTIEKLVTYDDTKCFKLEKVKAKDFKLQPDSFITLITLSETGEICTDTENLALKRSDKVFIPATCKNLQIKNTEVLICYPPKL